MRFTRERYPAALLSLEFQGESPVLSHLEVSLLNRGSTFYSIVEFKQIQQATLRLTSPCASVIELWISFGLLPVTWSMLVLDPNRPNSLNDLDLSFE